MAIIGGRRVFNRHSVIPYILDSYMCLLMCSTIKEIVRTNLSLVKKDLIIRECTFFFVC